MNILGPSQDEHVGLRLVRIRDKMSQEQFGAILGLTRRQISTMETGKVPVSSEVCIAIHRQFGVSLTWLLLGDGQTYVPGNHLTNDEYEVLGLVRRVPGVLQLIKRAIAGQEAICELVVMSQESGTSVGGQRQSAVSITKRLPLGREHAAMVG